MAGVEQNEFLAGTVLGIAGHFEGIFWDVAYLLILGGTARLRPSGYAGQPTPRVGISLSGVLSGVAESDLSGVAEGEARSRKPDLSAEAAGEGGTRTVLTDRRILGSIHPLELSAAIGHYRYLSNALASDRPRNSYTCFR